jgi:hypothetical protein
VTIAVLNKQKAIKHSHSECTPKKAIMLLFSFWSMLTMSVLNKKLLSIHTVNALHKSDNAFASFWSMLTMSVLNKKLLSIHTVNALQRSVNAFASFGVH